MEEEIVPSEHVHAVQCGHTLEQQSSHLAKSAPAKTSGDCVEEAVIVGTGRDLAQTDAAYGYG